MIAQSNELPPIEELQSLPDLSRSLPGKPSVSALWSWMRQGRKSVSGKTVKMQAWLGTNGKMSTHDAYRTFLEQLNDL